MKMRNALFILNNILKKIVRFYKLDGLSHSSYTMPTNNFVVDKDFIINLIAYSMHYDCAQVNITGDFDDSKYIYESWDSTFSYKLKDYMDSVSDISNKIYIKADFYDMSNNIYTESYSIEYDDNSIRVNNLIDTDDKFSIVFNYDEDYIQVFSYDIIDESRFLNTFKKKNVYYDSNNMEMKGHVNLSC